MRLRWHTAWRGSSGLYTPTTPDTPSLTLPRKTLRILVKRRMAPRIRTSGCLLSIIASVVLTVALNLLLRACMG